MSNKQKLTLALLIRATKEFCDKESKLFHKELYGVTDGKAVGTYVENSFKAFLAEKFMFEQGNTASGIDLPSINTDIKVTSIKQPQSSCPYKDSKQKIYGLGYNLIVFVYEKTDNTFSRKGNLKFVSCSLIKSERTGDFQTTSGLRRIIKNKGNVDDVFAFLSDHKIPADDVTLYNMSKEILSNPPMVGYLTISNALQWRLQYGRVVSLKKKVSGITSIINFNDTGSY